MVWHDTGRHGYSCTLGDLSKFLFFYVTPIILPFNTTCKIICNVLFNYLQLDKSQLYYVEELNVYEIAEILDLTNGRISQIKSTAIKKLRNEIKSII